MSRQSSLLRSSLRTHPRGAAVSDYLLIMTAIVGVAVPLVFKYLGEPLQRSFVQNRQNLVDFVAQNRKQTVPNVWFSKAEKMGELADSKELQAGEELTSGDLEGPAALKEGKELRTGELPEPKALTVGELGGGGVGGAGAGQSGAGSKGGSGSPTKVAVGGGSPERGESSLSQGFFGSDKQSGAEHGADETASGRVYAQSRSGEEGAGGDRGTGIGGQTEKKSEAKKDGQDSKGGAADSRRKSGADALLLAEEKARGSGEFDWGFLIRLLVILLILFIVILVLVANFRRKG
ncbi:MAG: hypothetical protein HY537_15835 [Deltaproteobacteria bacterium]|nr:hypothetical protein [Deltaproteobacteria bacterium]